ncbi:helix-turn-helix domain-containing protein [Pseudoroseomonas globiformis]|uniref:Helix-turn-helix domain-containing protein n=1 Tax=Teichococcus globiformis TaxID=2307229 RepID=A0ABV7G3B0_9PROT
MTEKAKGVPLDAMMARLPAARRKRVEAKAEELIAQHMALRDVRKAMGKTQAAVARALKIKQENVARIEARSDMLVSTLRNYIQALGGDVYLTVEMEGLPPMRLEGLGDLAPAATKPKAGSSTRRPNKSTRQAA